MKIYYQVRILPALPNHCLVEHDFLSLGKFGFYPENEEDKNEKTTTVFLAPTYVADETDRRYSFVDNEGSFRASPGESGLFGILARILEKTDLHYIYLTNVDQLIYKES